MTMDGHIAAILRDRIGSHAAIAEIVKLHGDASYRTYHRVRLVDGTTYIAMQMPPGKASVSEEITNFNGTHKELPFINVQRYLAGLGLPVPKVMAYDEEHHLMLLEDLGDRLLFAEVAEAGEGKRLEWYGRALDLLIRLQEQTRGGSAAACVANARSFDATLLNWEFDHFREYGVEARLGKEMASADRSLFEEATRSVSAAITALPYGFTHRDYQSRNLIIRDGELYLIDFQDALRGPAVYDLVALTRDSYVKLAPETVESLIRTYAERTGRPFDAVRREYDLVTVQRKLKDAGRFVFIDRVKKNPNYLPFIPTSLGYVREAMQRLPELSAFERMLRRYVPEWQ
jgi:N-acetylmuramate 1-kinase